MREIKFRAWNQHENKMTTPYMWIGDCNTFSCVMGSAPTHELMQFTELKDCNGVDIYEGDICRLEIDGLAEFMASTVFVGCVKFVDGSFIIANDMDNDGYMAFQEIAEVTVIGNIHQNPELLELSND